MKKRIILKRRAAICMAVLFILLFISILRVMSVSLDSSYKTAATRQGTYKLSANHQRGTIFDTNMVSLTNDEAQIIATVSPAFGAIDEVRDYLYDETPASLAHRLADGKPVLVRLKKEVNGRHVKSVTVYKDSGTLATHLIGYSDSSGHGVCGVQAAFDELLFSQSSVDFIYSESAAGDIIEDMPVNVTGESSVELSGVRLTIDSRIQQAVEASAAHFKSGAVIVSEVGTGKIRALASFPNYDIKNLSAYLNDASSPLINRAFCAYNVGSVFKPCVAAAALEESGFGSMMYECRGAREIAGKRFACHRASGHGIVDIKDAIRESCNTYFYTLAIKLGYQKIYDMASSLGFGTSYAFADNFRTEKGFLPDVGDASQSEQTLANISIGQGSLMLTPVSLLPLYEAIACGGVYHRPTLVEGAVINGVPEEGKPAYPTRVMSEQTAQTLKEALFEVIESGTGTSAKPHLCTAAGKTATAQTGWLDNGKAVDHSWLCGFFPADNPKYTVVIISENTSGGGTPCGPVFSAICDAIWSLNLS